MIAQCQNFTLPFTGSHKMLDFETPGYIFYALNVSSEQSNLVGTEGAIAGELICSATDPPVI